MDKTTQQTFDVKTPEDLRGKFILEVDLPDGRHCFGGHRIKQVEDKAISGWLWSPWLSDALYFDDEGKARYTIHKCNLHAASDRVYITPAETIEFWKYRNEKEKSKNTL